MFLGMPESPHAKASDLPGWPCPPRLRDIPNRENSWGFIYVSDVSGRVAVAQDELGHLWANGDTIPAFRTPNESNESPGGFVFWTQTGLGLWIHPKSLKYLPSISRLDMKPGQWLPVNEVAHEVPEHIASAC